MQTEELFGQVVAVPVQAGDFVVLPRAAVLLRVVVTVTGTNPLQIFDNATAGSGTQIAALPASPNLGVTEFNMPCGNGITVKGSATNPAVTVSYREPQ